MSLSIQLRPSLGTALVVGGGNVARRKVRQLAESEFSVVVVAPEIDPEIIASPAVIALPEAFSEKHLEHIALVFACTNDREVNHRVGALARQKGLPVLVADSLTESSFTSSAVYRSGDLSVAVSTHGKAPVAARKIRDVMAGLDADWQALIDEEAGKRPSNDA